VARHKANKPAPEMVRMPPDMKKYIEAIAWNEGTSMSEVADKYIRPNLERIFQKLPDVIRERYMRKLNESRTTPAA